MGLKNLFLKSVCEHSDTCVIGKFYKSYLSEYRNGNDEISLYVLEKCNNCGQILTKHISTETFLPERYDRGHSELKRHFIEDIRKLGYVMRHELPS